MKKLTLAIGIMLCTWMVQNVQAQTGGVNSNDTSKVSKGQPNSTTKSSPNNTINPPSGTDSVSAGWNQNNPNNRDEKDSQKKRNKKGYGDRNRTDKTRDTGNTVTPSGSTPPRK